LEDLPCSDVVKETARGRHAVLDYAFISKALSYLKPGAWHWPAKGIGGIQNNGSIADKAQLSAGKSSYYIPLYVIRRCSNRCPLPMPQHFKAPSQ